MDIRIIGNGLRAKRLCPLEVGGFKAKPSTRGVHREYVGRIREKDHGHQLEYVGRNEST